jgi:hypothetical protein
MKITMSLPAARPNKITGEKETFIHHRLRAGSGKEYIARAFPGGGTEYSSASDRPLSPKRDAHIIRDIQTALDARWSRGEADA